MSVCLIKSLHIHVALGALHTGLLASNSLIRRGLQVTVSAILSMALVTRKGRESWCTPATNQRFSLFYLLDWKPLITQVSSSTGINHGVDVVDVVNWPA